MSCFHPMLAVSTGLNFNGKRDIKFVAGPTEWESYPPAARLKIPCGRCVGCRLKLPVLPAMLPIRPAPHLSMVPMLRLLLRVMVLILIMIFGISMVIISLPALPVGLLRSLAFRLLIVLLVLAVAAVLVLMVVKEVLAVVDDGLIFVLLLLAVLLVPGIPILALHIVTGKQIGRAHV